MLITFLNHLSFQIYVRINTDVRLEMDADGTSSTHKEGMKFFHKMEQGTTRRRSNCPFKLINLTQCNNRYRILHRLSMRCSASGNNIGRNGSYLTWLATS